MRDPLKGQDRVDITVPRADALQLGALKIRSFVSHWKKIKCLGKGTEPRSRGPPLVSQSCRNQRLPGTALVPARSVGGERTSSDR